VALAGRVIASHYAEPLLRHLAIAAPLYAGRSEEQLLAELPAGEEFQMLDCSLGWAWGYAGAERRVGYVRAEVIKP